MPACCAQGPNPAEQRMLAAYDTFLTLLNNKPMVAQQLAYEVASVVERYNETLQPQRVAAPANEGDRHAKIAA